MNRERLVELLTRALERAAERLDRDGNEDPWPSELRAQDIVRLLREHSREVRYESNEGRELGLSPTHWHSSGNPDAGPAPRRTVARWVPA